MIILKEIKLFRQVIYYELLRAFVCCRLYVDDNNAVAVSVSIRFEVYQYLSLKTVVQQ